MISSKAILEVFLTDGSSAAQLWSVTLRIYIHRWLCTRARCLCPRRWPCSPSSVRSSTAVAAYSFLALYWLTTVACVVVGSPVSVVAGAFSSFNARLATKSFSSQLQLWAADWQQTKTTAEYSSIACLPASSSYSGVRLSFYTYYINPIEIGLFWAMIIYRTRAIKWRSLYSKIIFWALRLSHKKGIKYRF